MYHIRHRLVHDMLRGYGKKCEKVAESYVGASPDVSKCFVGLYALCRGGYEVLLLLEKTHRRIH